MKLKALHPNKENEKSIQQLYEAMILLETAIEAKKFFEDLCTPTEIQAMADRWRIVTLLKKHKSYRHISTMIRVSITTIGRVARCILLGSSGYNIIYQRLMNSKK